MPKSNAKIVPGLVPNTSVSITTEDIVFFNFNGSKDSVNIAARNINTISKSYPAIITLALAQTVTTGQTIRIAVGTGTMPQIVGYWKVLWANGLNVALDVDSSQFTTYTGTSTFNTLEINDVFGKVGPISLSGIATEVWDILGAVKTIGAAGVTANAGPYIDKSSNAIYDLSAVNSGRVAFSFEINMPASTVSSEMLFCLNKDAASGASIGNGSIYIGFSGGSINPTIYFCPKTGSDSILPTQVSLPATLLTAGVTSVVQFVIDFYTDTIYAYKDGSYSGSIAINRTNSIGNPAIGNGATFLCSMNGGGAIEYKMGTSVGIGLGAYIGHALFWKTQKTLAQTLRALSLLRRTGEFPRRLL